MDYSLLWKPLIPGSILNSADSLSDAFDNHSLSSEKAFRRLERAVWDSERTYEEKKKLSEEALEGVRDATKALESSDQFRSNLSLARGAIEIGSYLMILHGVSSMVTDSKLEGAVSIAVGLAFRYCHYIENNKVQRWLSSLTSDLRSNNL